jgi:ABC-type Na+ efflux pump permease subunit
MNATVASAESGISTPQRRRARPRFYVGIGVLMIALAVAGFWPQYYGAVVGGTVAPSVRFWLIHVHAAIFLGWLLLFLAQAGLVWSRRTELHRWTGTILAVYGFLAAAFGLFAGVSLAARLGTRTGNLDQAASFVFAPTIDMVFFAGFLAAAVVYRKRPETHKRAMLVATFSLATVGIGRLVDRIPFLEPGWLWQPATLSPILIAIGYDLVVRRKVHPVLLIGLILHTLRLNQEVYTRTEAWLPIGRALIRQFL